MTRQQAGADVARRSGPWGLVMIGFLALAISFSVRATFGLVIPSMERELHWSYSFISGVGAAALIIMAVAAPFAGRLIDRRGPRPLIVGGLFTVGLGAALLFATESKTVFVIGFGLVAALGFTALATNVVAAAISKQFSSGRGLATGIGTAGATAGQLLVVPVVALLMQTSSWRAGFLALSGASILLGVVALIALPKDVTHGTDGTGSESRQSMMAGVAALVRFPAFHLLFWSFLLCGFTTSGVVETHLLPYAAFCGFPPLPSATAYGILSAVNLGGMILSGVLSDRVHRPMLLAAIYLARAGTFVMLIFIGSDIRLLYLFAVLFGLFDYSTIPVTAGLAIRHLGIHRIGLAMGLISSGHALGGALGAFGGGVLFDVTGGYLWLWFVSFALALLAGLLVVFLEDNPARVDSAVDVVTSSK